MWKVLRNAIITFQQNTVHLNTPTFLLNGTCTAVCGIGSMCEFIVFIKQCKASSEASQLTRLHDKANIGNVVYIIIKRKTNIVVHYKK